jgi:hypothetical protein
LLGVPDDALDSNLRPRRELALYSAEIANNPDDPDAALRAPSAQS